jgi:hypothetical protein
LNQPNIIKLSALAFLLCSAPALATIVTHAELTFNEDAVADGTEIRLTDAINSQRGSVFTGPFAISAMTTFNVAFEFSISGDGSGADGLAFVVQNNSDGANAIGNAGGGLGYETMTTSVAVEFDTFQNGAPMDPDGNHVGINFDGSLVSAMTVDPGFSLEADNDTHFAWVDYDSAILSLFLSEVDVKPGIATLNQAFDLTTLGSQAYFGFTAGTGGFNSRQAIQSFDLTINPRVVVPAPGSLPLLIGGLGIFGLFSRLRKR